MAPNTPIPLSDFATKQIELIKFEMEAELTEIGLLLATASPSTLQKVGLAIGNLDVASTRVGYGGRVVVELENTMSTLSSTLSATSLSSARDKGEDEARPDFADHLIKTGDIVAIQQQPTTSAWKKKKEDLSKAGVEGVVTKVSASSIWVACDHGQPEIPEGRLWIVKMASEVTYRRMLELMSNLQSMPDHEQTPLMRILLGSSEPQIPSEEEISRFDELTWHLPNLNDSQKDAIRFALASPDVALIHGPPGTGKTHTLVELILQTLKDKPNGKILVCGPSNISVDNIVERLFPHKIPMVRLGHPARLLPAVMDHSLDVLTRTSGPGEMLKDVRRDLEEKQASARKARSGRERHAIYMEMRELQAEYRTRERRCVGDLLAGSRVILSTLHGVGGPHLQYVPFDLVIVDEASQALEAQNWLAVMVAPKLVLAGDHLQLPPTVKSLNMKALGTTMRVRKPAQNSNKLGITQSVKTVPLDSPARSLRLEVSLFDRLLDLYGSSIKRMLKVQYRMHQTIMEYPSDALYGGNLVAADAVKDRLLRHINTYHHEVEETEDTTEPIVFFDTQGGLFPEIEEGGAGSHDEDGANGKSNGRNRDQAGKTKKGKSVISLLGKSTLNEMEGQLAVMHAKSLVAAGVSEEDIAVITPYSAQVGYISPLLKAVHPGIEVGTVDGFQGREKEAVILSLVRSNSSGDVGFLGERRRLNVAMTRPKRHLCVIGDSETVARGSKYLKEWMDFLANNADLRFPDPSDLGS